MRKLRSVRFMAVLCAVSLIIASAGVAAVADDESGTVFFIRSDVSAPGSTVSLGDIVTFTVDVAECPAIVAGSVCARAGSSFEFISATFCGEETTADPADEPNEGAYVIDILDPDSTMSGFVSDYCSFTYRVTGLDDATFEFYCYQCIVSEYTEIDYTVSPSEPLAFDVAQPEKPVITSPASLPKGALGIPYSYMLESDGDPMFTEWDIASGTLPDGIELLSSGEISGIPAEFGVFEFSATASILGVAVSEPVEFTVEILEKPTELVLVPESGYSLEAADGAKYVTGVKARTTAADVVSNFETPEYITVTDAGGNEMSPDDIVGTGFTVALVDGGTVMDSATVIVLGDVSGDGRISTIDYQRIRAYYIGTYEMDGAYLRAAHVSGGARVGTIDYQRVRAHYLGTYDIYA